MAAATSYGQDLTKREHYEMIRTSLALERTSFEGHWRDLNDYIQPRRTRFFVTDRNRGERRSQKIIDSTATFAARTLRSGMHAGLTSPARPWMKLTVPDPDLAEYGSVKEWLHTVTQRMLTAFAKSNLYNVLPTIYGDMGTFAIGSMGVIDDDRDLFRCYSYPVGSYWLGISERQQVDTCIREWQMTVRQLVARFGRIPGTRDIDWSNISKTVKGYWEKGQYENYVDVCWIVCPNEDADPKRLGPEYLPWASYHFEKGSDENKFLRKSGFHEFPILAPRWDVNGEDIYGSSCPGMDALSDVRGLQIMQKKKAQAVEKMINPPLSAPTSIQNRKVSLLPGDVTFVDVLQTQQGLKSIHDVNLRISELREDIQDTRFLIRRAFYEDLFLMLAQMDNAQPVTAREIEERHEEKLLALGPVLERTNDELLDPLIDRVYAIMERAGMIPEPPRELEGVALKVEYISVMAQAQKLVSVAGLDRFFRSTVPLIGAFPEMRHKINAMQAVDEYGEALGINPKLVIPDDDAMKSLQAEQQQQAQLQQAQLAAAGAKSAKDLSGATLETDSALKRMVEG